MICHRFEGICSRRAVAACWLAVIGMSATFQAAFGGDVDATSHCERVTSAVDFQGLIDSRDHELLLCIDERRCVPRRRAVRTSTFSVPWAWATLASASKRYRQALHCSPRLICCCSAQHRCISEIWKEFAGRASVSCSSWATANSTGIVRRVARKALLRTSSQGRALFRNGHDDARCVPCTPCVTR